MDISPLVSRLGREWEAKLANPAVEGQPEDQLRGPFERFLSDFGATVGSEALRPTLVGETQISELKTRPDYAVTRQKGLIGHVELKQPRKGVDPRRYGEGHDKDQWNKLKALPNLLYCNGQAFALFRDGELVGDIVRFEEAVKSVGAKLSVPNGLEALLSDFLSWTPQPPRDIGQLAATSARLCRLLREEVEEQMAQGAEGLAGLAQDIRELLFPEWTDNDFADGYAQSVTFGLLMARARGISLDENLGAVARKLKANNGVIGAALGVLTEGTERARLKTSLDTMTRVLGVVDWHGLSADEDEPWLNFYEDFLQVYDKGLRKKTGSYYTPPEVVRSMVDLCEEALRTRFDMPLGFADGGVKVVDPAVGTGTYLLGVLDRISETVESRDGPGMVPGQVRAALDRIAGFELQFGPFAVAQLRLLAEIAKLTKRRPEDVSDSELRLFVADTLADPDEDSAWIPSTLRELGQSRKDANHLKRHEPVTVVLGNPPYKNRASGLGGWVEERGADQRAPMDDWTPPREWGVGTHAHHLHNLYVYFWRWAAWKVFGGDPYRSGGDKADAVFSAERGVVCFITAAGFLNGDGFQKMRADLRAQADEIWVIDCTPEGLQPAVPSRIFQGVQQPVCIVIAVKTGAERIDADAPHTARTRFIELPMAHRKKKFEALLSLSLDGEGWEAVPDEPRAPFLPKRGAEWAGYPGIQDLFENDYSGVKPGRTWPVSADTDSLERRWKALTKENDSARKSILFRPAPDGTRTLDRVLRDGVPSHEYRDTSVGFDRANVVSPVRYGYRSFDRQWLVPDKRLIDRDRKELWRDMSAKQIFAFALNRTSPSAGPAITFSSLVPDNDFYKGSAAGRVLPLWADAEASRPNLRPAVLDTLSESYGTEVGAEDLFAYIAAVAAHPGYTETFADELRRPGLRLPVTLDAELFAEAAELGRRVVWLHTYGERFTGPDRPAGAPRVPNGPRIPEGGAMPSDAEGYKAMELRYDAAARRLHLGTGHVDGVAPEVFAYEVSGMRVIPQWFSYRRWDRSRPIIGDRRPPSPLNDIKPERWLPEYTSDLLDLLHVLTGLVRMEGEQADLLRRIVEGEDMDVGMFGDALPDGI